MILNSMENRWRYEASTNLYVRKCLLPKTSSNFTFWWCNSHLAVFDDNSYCIFLALRTDTRESVLSPEWFHTMSWQRLFVVFDPNILYPSVRVTLTPIINNNQNMHSIINFTPALTSLGFLHLKLNLIMAAK